MEGFLSKGVLSGGGFVLPSYPHIHTLSLIILIILEASIYDEGVLSEEFMSERSICADVIYGEGFVPDSLPPEASMPDCWWEAKFHV